MGRRRGSPPPSASRCSPTPAPVATTQRRPERWLIRFDIEIATIAVVASDRVVRRPRLARTWRTRRGRRVAPRRGFGSFALAPDHRARRPRQLLGGTTHEQLTPIALADPVHHTVLVPLDGSHLADGALPTARALAARFGATIHTVTVAVSDFELAAHPRPKRRTHSAPTLTTHASTSRSTPTSPPPFTAAPRSSNPASSACRPTGGDGSPAA